VWVSMSSTTGWDTRRSSTASERCGRWA
jgi:hypothetical protein